MGLPTSYRHFHCRELGIHSSAVSTGALAHLSAVFTTLMLRVSSAVQVAMDSTGPRSTERFTSADSRNAADTAPPELVPKRSPCVRDKTLLSAKQQENRSPKESRGRGGDRRWCPTGALPSAKTFQAQVAGGIQGFNGSTQTTKGVRGAFQARLYALQDICSHTALRCVVVRLHPLQSTHAAERMLSWHKHSRGLTNRFRCSSPCSPLHFILGNEHYAVTA
eukprot:1149523-Pelagomonas_calceolata.AAC.7